ncbi:MAG TPA: FAD-dependent oxidoreductase [Rhizomicrobium sp.]|nr:FAD-dependent oxidoreductase [Rhizomicrobium sp.]
MQNSIVDRRSVLKTSLALSGLAGLEACTGIAPPLVDAYRPVIAPVRARSDRIFDISVCLRPFRAAGPRLDTETIGRTLIVHNYGHGGSGWSLSWGSGTIAVKKAMMNSPGEIAVIGCGALGLTSAILAQKAGAKVTIYAREQLPQTRSARATGSWTPDSRIALADKVSPDFPALWEEMARTSFRTFRSYLGLPGEPVEWIDRYVVTDNDPGDHRIEMNGPGALPFAEYYDRIADLTPHRQMLPPGSTSFGKRFVSRNETLMFNIADYGHTLMTDFLLAGGRLEMREFHAPAEFGQLKEKVVINCTGYGARDLWKDDSIVPVRGQIQWLIPQPEVKYGLFYDGINVLSRRDGICVQSLEGGDMQGYGDTNEAPDRAEADAAVNRIAPLFADFGGTD